MRRSYISAPKSYCDYSHLCDYRKEQTDLKRDIMFESDPRSSIFGISSFPRNNNNIDRKMRSYRF